MSSYQASTARVSDERDAFAVNTGLANSGRGEGTTTPELVSRFRFLNVSASLSVLLFHTLGLLLNPMRLGVLLTSPVRVLLEAAAGSLALALLVVEARVPLLAERVLRRVDLDGAGGRAAALAAVGACIVLSGYLTTASGGAGTGATDPVGPAIDGGGDGAAIIDSGNYTAANATDGANATDVAYKHGGSGGGQPTGSFVAAIVVTALTSPTALIVLAAAAYTARTVYDHAGFAEHRHYNLAMGGRPGGALTPTGESGRPSWTAAVGQLGSGRGSYQTVES